MGSPKSQSKESVEKGKLTVRNPSRTGEASSTLRVHPLMSEGRIVNQRGVRNHTAIFATRMWKGGNGPKRRTIQKVIYFMLSREGRAQLCKTKTTYSL